MNSFPVITNDLIGSCMSRLQILYSGDSVKLLQAAQHATLGELVPFVIKTGVPISSQINVIEARIKRTADGYGQKLFIKIIEYLYEDLKLNGAVGVTNSDFLDCTKIVLQDKSEIQYNAKKKWHWLWKLEVDGNPGLVDLDIRFGNTIPGEIVPDYILQYIQQGMAAFNNGKYAVSMSLMTIALEGTLRDALDAKGYSYQPGTPTQDVYETKEMQVYKDPTGYKVIFPDIMPLAYTDYLSNPSDPAYKSFKIKRVKKANGEIVLEMRKVTDLLNHWSSDIVNTAGIKNVSGLGAALDIGRNLLTIISSTDLPEDLDKPIQHVRNNLIHLSGSSMSEVVQTDIIGNNVTLEEFLKNKNRVFDAVCTIGSAINTIYNRKANGSL